MLATTYFTSLCFHVPLSESLEEAFSYRTTEAGHLCKNICLKKKKSPSSIAWANFFFCDCCCAVLLETNDRENSSHVDKLGVFNLEGDGSIVGSVCGHDACSFSHLVTANFHLTHLSQAGWKKRGKGLEGFSDTSPHLQT